MSLATLALPADVIDIRPSAADIDQARLVNLIAKASSKLRAAAPFDIDARIALFTTLVTAGVDNPVTVEPTALDPVRVADRVAVIVKRFLANEDGVASSSEGAGPFSQSRTFVNRYDKTGADVRGELRVTEEDIDELRPAVTFTPAASVRVGIPTPSVFIPPGDSYQGIRSGALPLVVQDVSALPDGLNNDSP